MWRRQPSTHQERWAEGRGEGEETAQYPQGRERRSRRLPSTHKEGRRRRLPSTHREARRRRRLPSTHREGGGGGGDCRVSTREGGGHSVLGLGTG